MTRAAPLSHAVASAARRRAMVADWVRLAPFYLAGAAIGSASVIASCRYFHLPMQWQLIAIGAASVAVAGTLLHGVLNRWTLRHAAAEIDRALGLKDQLGIALELSAGTRNDPGFTSLAIDAGEAAARQVDVSRAVKISWRPSWWFAAIASVGLAAAAWWYMPAPAPPRVTTSQAQKALEAAKQVAKDSDPVSPQVLPQPELTELDQIEKELAQGKATPADAATRAASVLERAADERSKDAQAAQSQAEQTRDKLARAANRPATDQSPADASAIRKALQTGDLDKAAAEAQKLAENAERLSPEERSSLQRDLRDLADALDQQAREDAAAAAKTPKPETDPSDPASDPAKDSPQQDPKADKPSPSAAQPPESKPQSEAQKIADAARKAADELKKPAQNETRPQPAPSDSRKSESQPQNKQTPSDETKPNQDQKKDGQQGEEKKPESRGDNKPDEKPAPQSGDKTSEKTGDKSVEKSGEKDQSKSSGQNPDGKQPDSKPSGESNPAATGEKTGDTSRQTQGKPSDGSQTSPSGEKEQQGDTKGGQKQPDSSTGNQKQTQPGDSGDKQQTQESKGVADRSGNKKDGTPEGTPQGSDTNSGGGKDQKPDSAGQKDGQQPAQGTANKEGNQQPQGGSGLQKLARELKDMQNKSKDAAKNEKSSQQMREQARKILQDMDPAQRKELEKLAQGAGNGQGPGTGAGDQPQNPANAEPNKPWSGASKVVDFRTKPGDAAAPGKERVISDWQKQTPDGQRTRSETGSAMEDDIRQAREGAERAIEQQSVPAQHRDLVRRVFERFNDRAKPASTNAPPAAAPDAKPASGSGGR